MLILLGMHMIYYCVWTLSLNSYTYTAILYDTWHTPYILPISNPSFYPLPLLLYDTLHLCGAGGGVYAMARCAEATGIERDRLPSNLLECVRLKDFSLPLVVAATVEVILPITGLLTDCPDDPR